ncbi:hypothetical protein UlMin_015660 [Ulmus minor]
MIRLWVAYLQLAELFVSSIVHLLYGFYIFSSGVAGDLSQALNDLCFKPNVNIDVSEGTVANVDNLPPIVLVHGIFGFGKGYFDCSNCLYSILFNWVSDFSGAEKKDERVLMPDLGSLTSIYNGAQELFYYLKGGKVDYGEEHSKACGHSQFGHYPEWDEDHPVHFVRHSAGAQVVRVLQQMLADKAFKGFENINENWVLSITSLFGAFNGTTRTYLDGMPEDGRSTKNVCLLQRHIVSFVLYFCKAFFSPCNLRHIVHFFDLLNLKCIVVILFSFLLKLNLIASKRINMCFLTARVLGFKLDIAHVVVPIENTDKTIPVDKFTCPEVIVKNYYLSIDNMLYIIEY